jgi:DNA-binding helix-hairpin-helix protein with protein kinase domain
MNNEPDAGIVVTDELGRRFPLGDCLGRGGQGAVYAVPGSRIVVKRLVGRGARRERIEARIRAIRRLDLDGIAIARPVAFLREPHFGYVMELMAEMVPLATLLPSAGRTHTAEHFRSDGGLGRRLRLLARAADVISQLHGRGLAYGDISASNILISDSIAHNEVQLIDPDNLAFFSAPDTGSAYTPKFGAPELIDGTSGHTSLTDAHAFAVTVCWLLRGTHPLLGDEVNGDDPELEGDALAGRLPWIDDPGDRRNATIHGIPADVVYSPLLRELAARAFGPGLLDPVHRPGVAEWAERLHGAAELVLTCAKCGNGFYANRQECPWCDAPRPPHLFCHVWVQDPEFEVGARDQTRVGLFAVETGVDTRVPRRHLWADAPGGAPPAVQLHWDGRLLRLQVFDGTSVRLVTPAGTRPVGEEPTEISPGDVPGAEVHLGPADQLHRVLSFGVRRGGQ